MKPKLALLWMLIVAGAAALFVQHRSQVTLRQENQVLRAKAVQMDSLSAENDRLSNQLARATKNEAVANEQLRELIKLRNEVATLRQQKRDSNALRGRASASAPRRSAPVADSTRPVKVPRESWANVGYATPEAALQTVLWAMSKGDVATLRTALTDNAKESLASQYAGKSDAEIAQTLIDEVQGLSELPVGDKRISEDGSVRFKVNSTESTTITDDGSTAIVKDETFMTFKKVGDAWRFSP